jgi:serine phosphatase RsbU (regulator of sigma subunit)
LPQPTASSELTLGRLKWDVVGAAKAPLLDGATQATPWIVLGIGLLLAVGLAMTVETLIRLYHQQRIVLGNVQRALLPKGLPDVPGFEFAARYVPATRGLEIGGDWYSIVRIDEDRFAMVIGDVTGHGIDAAGVMARARYTIRVLVGLGFPADEALERTSRELDMDVGDQFATAAVCVVDRSAQQLTVASAGHLPPLLITAGQAEFVKIEPGEPLGVSGPAPVPSSISFASGSTLVAFTDGLVERRGETIDVSLERLAAAAAQSPSHPEQLIEHLLTALVGTDHEDDIAMIAVRAL